MTLVIDGVFLQLQRRGATRLWRALLALLVRKLDMPIVLLDRSGRSEQFSGIEVVPYPTYKPTFNSHDSALLERVCAHYAAHVFLSTHYTTPLQTPSVVVVCDMVPEQLGIGMGTREQQEKEVAIAHARRHICISEQTRHDLLTHYPELDVATIRCSPFGVDEAVYKPATTATIKTFKSRYDLNRPFFIAFEADQNNPALSNTDLLMEALALIRKADFDVLCVTSDGTKPTTTLLANGCRLIKRAPEDDELALAFAAAEAVIDPGFREGHGLPVANAMACGCPIIAISGGHVAAVAQDAAISIDGTSPDQLVDAMRALRNPITRNALSTAGVLKAPAFRWELLADSLVQSIVEVAAESSAGVHRRFYDTWARLRAIQGEVDILP